MAACLDQTDVRSRFGLIPRLHDAAVPDVAMSDVAQLIISVPTFSR